MHFHAGHNMPGYLPESEPLCCDDWEMAQRYAIWVMLRDADNTDDEDKATELASTAEDLNLHNGPEWSVTVGNTSYWITQSDEDCDDERQGESPVYMD